MTDSDSYQGLLGGGAQRPPAAPVPPTPPIPGPPPAVGPSVPRQPETASERTQVLHFNGGGDDAGAEQAETAPPAPWGALVDPQQPAADPRSFFDRPGGSGPLPRVDAPAPASGGVGPQAGWTQPDPPSARPQHAQAGLPLGPQGPQSGQQPPQWVGAGAGDGDPRHVNHGADGLQATLPSRKPKPPRPQQGWQRVISALTFGKVNPAPGAKEQAELEDVALTRSQPTGTYRIAVIGGNAGATAVTSALGSTFSSKRGDKVLVIDGTQKIGNLLDRVEGGARVREGASVQTLLDSLRSISANAGAAGQDKPVAVGFSAMTGHMAQNPERLFALGANQRSDAKPLSSSDYAYIQGPLDYHFNLVLIDVGDHLRDPATREILRTADAAVLASSSTLDGANHAHRLVKWLKDNGYGALVQRTVAVISETDRERSAVKNADVANALLGAGVRQAVEVPFDPHIHYGSEISLPQLKRATARAYLEATAELARDFAIPAAGGAR